MAPASTWPEAPTPRVFTIPPEAAFVDALAAGVIEAVGTGEPLALADVIVLAPNRRAARALREAFARRAADRALLTPTVQPIGDVAEDEPPFEPDAIDVDLPPAIEPAHRLFELAALTRRWVLRQGRGDDPAAALALAEPLAALIDDFALEPDADIAALSAGFVDAPQHFLDAAAFLAIVREYWPQRLKALGLVDPGARRAALIRSLIERWRVAPPNRPIIAAGSTGTQAPTRALMVATAQLPAGAVVLPGLDAELDEAAWTALDEAHPQTAMRRFLDAAGVARRDVRLWPGVVETPSGRARRRLVNDALRPASATADWLDRLAALGPPAEIAAALKGVSLYEASSADAEGRTIAFVMREALEHPERTVMLVTPDASLVRRVEAHLARWGVEADASIGEPMLVTPLGAFLAATLAPVRRPDSALDLAVLAKHPLTACAWTEPVWAQAVADLERLALRGVRRGDGWSGWRQRLNAARPADEPAARAGLDALGALETALAPLSALAIGMHPLAAFARAHAEAAEALATLAQAPDRALGAERLWRGPAGEAAARLFESLIAESAVLGEADLDGYARVFERLAAASSVRRPQGGHPRLRIYAPIEARLQTADVVVLGGLNEGVWPAPPAPDPLVSRSMRRAAGLPDPERRLGSAAHDFAQLLSAPRVILTRAQRREDAPAVASRWLWRLKTLARGAQASLSDEAAAPFERIARAIDRARPEEVERRSAPRPTPPVSARPRSASVSDVRLWVRDPYGFYAKRVLELTPREDFDREPDARERGTAIHRALYELREAFGASDFADRFLNLAEAALVDQGYRHADLAAERPRLRRIGVWFATWDAARRADGWRLKGAEAKGRISLSGPAGAFELHARADRLDAGASGWAIIDYKTGGAPTAPQAKAGLEPQMPLQGVIMQAGGFPAAPAVAPLDLLILKLSGGRHHGEATAMKDVEGLIEAARVGLERRIAAFDRETTAYDARSRRPMRLGEVGDFDRLARRKEWAGPDEAEGGEA